MNSETVQTVNILEPKQFHRRLEAIFENLNTSGHNEWLTQLFLSAFRSYLAEDLHICAIHLYDTTGDPAELLSSWGKSMPSVELLIRERKNQEIFPWFVDRTGSRAIILPFGDRPDLLLAFFWDDRVDRDLFNTYLASYFSSLHYALLQHFRKLKLQDALEEAREIQLSLLPFEPPCLKGFDIAARTIPARTVGGDVYDFFPLNNEIVTLVIADAAGHGLPAALQARDVITGLRMGIEKRTALDHVIQKLNRVIHRSGLVSRFVSLVVGELHADGSFFYINAGHPAPIWMSNSQWTKLQTSGMILGPRFDQNYKTGYIQMQMGDSLLFYTDGILEHTSRNGTEFGVEGLTECLQSCKNDSAEKSIEYLYETLRNYGAGEPFHDDASVLLVKRSEKAVQ
jgi:serine phosphatase RsbU (regulator of sigma subunit)